MDGLTEDSVQKIAAYETLIDLPEWFQSGASRY